MGLFLLLIVSVVLALTSRIPARMRPALRRVLRVMDGDAVGATAGLLSLAVIAGGVIGHRGTLTRATRRRRRRGNLGLNAFPCKEQREA